MIQFKIHGMCCAEEISILKREIAPIVGGEDRLSFDILQGKMSVNKSGPESTRQILDAIARTGMHAELWQEKIQREEKGHWLRYGRTVLTLASGIFALIGFLVHTIKSGSLSVALGIGEVGNTSSLPVQTFYALSIATGLWQVLPKAWQALKRFQPDMNFLMTVAVVGALLIGEWLEAAIVTFLFSVSLVLESWSVGRARQAIAALMSLAPELARMKSSNGKEEEVPIEKVKVGARIVVRPGERIPLDGRVVSGISFVNQMPITGESLPVPKQHDDSVFAGSINGEGLLELETTRPANDTTIARIIKQVSEAQSRRAPAEQWVEHFAKVYTPAIMILAFVVAVGPPLVFGYEFQTWTYRGLALLVIGCPCALVISTPVSIVAAMTASARNGILIKGGVYMEAPASTQAIAFDKTGTLTVGKPLVTEAIPLSGHSNYELIERAAAIEANSNHPLAHAIVAHAKALGVPVRAATEFQIIQGKGACARLEGRLFWLGSHRYLEERGQETPEVHQRLEAMARAGQTVIVIGNETHVCGLIALADEVRPESKAAIASLKGLGVKHIVMLTGDNQGTAEVIAKKTGVDAFEAELLPENKVQAIESLVKKYGNVIMVGDGINDAPALARAHVGIAMGAAGSDAAIESSDIALMSDDLSRLPLLIKHSKRTIQVIHQNIIAALGTKVVFLVLATFGVSSLWLAIAADMGVTLAVVFNGLRLLSTAQNS